MKSNQWIIQRIRLPMLALAVRKGFYATLISQVPYSNVVAAVSLNLNGVLPMTDAQNNEAANASWYAIKHSKNTLFH
ncbi:hypothetical protein Q4512_00755 [Oceanihabitans sp. 2_MG-2023]|uniref:hypothetical protein n=1 Tax=Oceanihabitans sp. 2_MG-2023 TaxID=3062661 RepID=UPI0026E366DD|nr:hypothetical protein [Oceanihabitans sp. 2_MG-2023]MDO6595420.1 hypothetical protein [Oceanihabitans sp. 2_MG-2023]